MRLTRAEIDALEAAEKADMPWSALAFALLLRNHAPALIAAARIVKELPSAIQLKMAADSIDALMNRPVSWAERMSVKGTEMFLRDLAAKLAPAPEPPGVKE